MSDHGGNTPKLIGRWRACLKAWPECEDGAYDPRCCRFPKSCSCDVYDDINYDPRYVVPDPGRDKAGGSGRTTTAG